MRNFLLIPEIEDKIEYSFRNPQLLIQAFTHPSFKNENPDYKEDNERLEFIGDSVLNLIVSEYLFITFPNINEGILSTIRSSLVNAKACYQYTTALEVGPFLLIGKGEQKLGSRGLSSAYANLFESLLGAVYLDSHIDAAKKITLRVLPPNQDILLLTKENPKNILQQLTQQKWKILPQYLTKDLSSPTTPFYFVEVFVKNDKVGEGSASSKKEAELLAAQQALEYYDHKN